MLMIISRKKIGFYYQKLKYRRDAEKSTQNAFKNALKLQIFSTVAPVGTAGKYFKI